MMDHKVVSREEWIEARKALLDSEKSLTHMRDRIAAERRALPWVRVEKTYEFDTPDGRKTLADLFDGRSQLFVQHFMLAPGETTQCVGCSFEADHLQPAFVHLRNHDVSLIAVARAPLAEIEVLRQRMGWHFPFVSSYGSDFNYDFNVSFTPEQVAAKRANYNFQDIDPGMEDLHGNSVFYRDDQGQIFHTYSAYGRGAESLLTTYVVLDMTPKGRNEKGDLTDWVRPSTMYGKGGMVEPNGRYHAPTCGCSVHT
ncbi:DUF899 domain-containing protein [Leptospira interrogans]